jgi:DNA repair protein RecN (Recombination protein N)
MLISIRVQNFALIEDIDVDFASGFNVLTGETGAGKSIILGALDLLLGARASTDAIRAGEDRAIIEGLFAIDEGDARDALDELDLQEEDPSILLVRRVLARNGRSRITVNGHTVTISMLRKVTHNLVDLSTQHNQYALLQESAHLEILDRYAGLRENGQAFAESHEHYRSLVTERSRLLGAEQKRIEREDFLRFQLDEITAAEIEENEDVSLQSERNRLRHASHLQTESSQATAKLSSSHGGALSALHLSIEHIQKMEALDPEVSTLVQRVDSARIEIEDISFELEKYAQTIVCSPSRLAQVEERHSTLRRLMRKYGGTLEAVTARQLNIEEELQEFTHCEERLESLETEIATTFENIKKKANTLSIKRKKAAKKLTAMVEKELQSLSLKSCHFRTDFQTVIGEDGFNATGCDRVSFELAPNVGEGFQPLTKAASGGELSRILLALKSALVAADPVATSIYDEVDTGVGGAVAERIGQKLKGASTSRQVICITHLPQVAAYGHRHLHVSKETEKGRTRTCVSILTEKERLDELARMLGGVKRTKRVEDHAKELLDASLAWNPVG